MYNYSIAIHCMTTPSVNTLRTPFLENVTRTQATNTFLAPPIAPQRPARSLRPRFLLVHGALLDRSITPATCHDLQESAPQASGQASLSMRQVLAYDSVYLMTPHELHKPSIADHTCILFLIRLPFKPHLISPSCIHPFSPSARPGGMREAVQ